MSVRRPAELGLPHHTRASHQSMQTALTRTRREAQLNSGQRALCDTHTHHSFYCSHWDHLCWCCVLQDLGVNLSAWVSFFPFFSLATLFSSSRRPSPLGLAICSPCWGTRRSLWLQALSHSGKNCQLAFKKYQKYALISRGGRVYTFWSFF